MTDSADSSSRILKSKITVALNRLGEFIVGDLREFAVITEAQFAGLDSDTSDELPIDGLAS